MLQWASKIDREREMNQWQKSGMWIVGMLGTLLLIAGCASKEDKALFEKIQRQSPELRTLQQSEKAIFDAGDENETIVIATYLPEESKEYERFVVAAYPVERLAGKKPFLLEGKAPLSRRKVSRASLPERIRRTLPGWFTVYRLDFPKVSGKKFILSIRDIQGEERKLTFYKGPKYLVTKPTPRF
jgi:hypothetical protein